MLIGHHSWSNGGGGNDVLFGGGHDEILIGGAGDDVIYGDDGADTIDGAMGTTVSAVGTRPTRSSVAGVTTS